MDAANQLLQGSPRVPCVQWDTLVEFCRARLPDPVFDGIASHLVSCRACAQRLVSVEQQCLDDSLTERIKRCLMAPPLLPEPGYSAMENAVKAFAGAQRPATVPTERPNRAGELIGSYEILEEVGQGGMGVVYRARHRAFVRIAAIKMLRAGALAGNDARVRFRTEAEAIARVLHPNVVQLYEFGECGGLLYYAMEWVNGGNLGAKLGEGPLPVRAAAELVQTLALAAESAHRQHVVHRDLKPSNILLTVEGTPKISDFGLARLIDSTGNGITQTDMVLGTPSYMAPEQAEGRPQEAGPTADVYSLGAILYEALTGAAPFRGATKHDTLRLVRHAEPAPPSCVRAGIAADLEAICLKCLAKPPHQRYPSAQALAEDLGQWLRGIRPRGVPGPMQRGLRQGWRGLRRHRVMVAATLTMVASMVVAAVLRLHDPDQQLRKMQAELQEGRAVELIGESGPPAWSRWRAGETHSKTLLASDGSFTLHAWALGLLELLPDPQVECYRLTGQVRHLKCDQPGEVGLYFAHQACAGEKAPLHFCMQLTFNGVRASAGPGGLGKKSAKGTSQQNAVRLFAHLYAEDGLAAPIDCRMPGATGPWLTPAGEDLDPWHAFTIDVNPSSLSAAWDGQAFQLDRDALHQTLGEQMVTLRTRYPHDAVVQHLALRLAPRGGLGLYVWRGSASFRQLTLAPLPARA